MDDGEFELDAPKGIFYGQFVRGKSHVNCIESFWSFTKRRLAQFNGLRDEMFYLLLKESEFRFNNRHNDLYVILLKNLRQNYRPYYITD